MFGMEEDYQRGHQSVTDRLPHSPLDHRRGKRRLGFFNCSTFTSQQRINTYVHIYVRQLQVISPTVSSHISE